MNYLVQKLRKMAVEHRLHYGGSTEESVLLNKSTVL